MALCWNCGHDKLGEPEQDLSSDIEQELMVAPAGDCNPAEVSRYRAVLFRLALAGWCVTGLFMLLTGPTPIHDWHRSLGSSVDYIVVISFYLSLFLTLALIADLQVVQKDAAVDDAPRPSLDLHKPWVRGWLTRGWGRFLFWFAWGWLLIDYLG